MSNLYVVTAFGKDRPGIVAAVSKALYDTKCNLEDSSMTILRGNFAILLVVRAPDTLTLPKLRQKLKPVSEDMGLVIHADRCAPEKPAPQTEGAGRYVVSVYGADRAGIVYKVTRRLSKDKINITDLATRVVGDKPPLYIMLMEVEVPAKADMARLEKDLLAEAKRLSCDVSLKPVEVMRL